MTDRINFDMFSKNKSKKQTTNERDADEIKVTGAIITTDKKKGVKGKKTITQTDTWGEGEDIKALEGVSMEDKPKPNISNKGRFTNTKNKNINWNKKLDSIPEKKTTNKMGTWDTEVKPKNTWDNAPKKKGII